jgi:putative FmdB family regulatory protein
MPTYDYDCKDCGTFAAMKRIAARDEPTDCPGCGRPASRMVAAPQLGWMEGDARRATAKLASEGSYPRMRHAGGACSCC